MTRYTQLILAYSVSQKPIQIIVVQNEILNDWKDIHKNTQHGLTLCCNLSKVNIIEVIEIPSVLEVLPFVLEIEKKTILLALVYHMPGPLGSFIDDLISLINALPTQHD